MHQFVSVVCLHVRIEGPSHALLEQPSLTMISPSSLLISLTWALCSDAPNSGTALLLVLPAGIAALQRHPELTAVPIVSRK